MVHQTAVTALGQSDVVSCLALNYHSTLLASSSADHSITVIPVDPSTLTFSAATQGQPDGPKARQTFKGHDSAVLCLAWAHPEFGTVLASGAVDGSVKVWTCSGSKWTSKITLNDARGSVRSIEFGHREFGLKLATLASDSRLRVYECLDPVKATDWTMTEDIDLTALPTSLSSPGPAPSTVTSAALPKSSSSLAPTSTASTGSSDSRKTGTIESDGAWSLSWLKEHWWGERIAVSAGTSGLIRLFHLQAHSSWNNFLNISPSKSSTAAIMPVSSLAFAPASGRSYQLLASGARDGKARIYKIYPPNSASFTRRTLEDSMTEDDEDEASSAWRYELEAELDDPNAPGSKEKNGVASVKVDWNLTGTVLSTAGDDAKVRLWKPTYTGQWRTVAVLGTEGQE